MRSTIPSDVNTLMTSRVGAWVLVDSILQCEDAPNCAHRVLQPGMFVQVTDVGADGVTIVLLNGERHHIGSRCAGYVQVEQATAPGDAAQRSAP